MSWQEEAQAEMWDAIAEQDSRRSVEAAKEAELETDDGDELVAEVVGALLGDDADESNRRADERDRLEAIARRTLESELLG